MEEARKLKVESRDGMPVMFCTFSLQRLFSFIFFGIVFFAGADLIRMNALSSHLHLLPPVICFDRVAA